MQNEIRNSEEILGHALRQRRASQHLSLRTLAQRTGYSPSFLSQVENGQSSPSLSSIAKITEQLNVRLWEFFQTLESRPGEMSSRSVAESNGEPHTPGSDKSSLASRILELGHGDSRDSPESLPFDEFAYVVEGTVELLLDTGPHTLRAGDSMMLGAGHSRQWRNSNGGPARVLVVTNVGTSNS